MAVGWACETTGILTERVMAAMEAADAAGGDCRCSCDNPRNPVAAAPCTAKASHVAYLLRAEAADASGPAYSDGQPALFIDVTDQNITADEDANPFKTLRKRYDATKKSGRRAATASGRPPQRPRRACTAARAVSTAAPASGG